MQNTPHITDDQYGKANYRVLLKEFCCFSIHECTVPIGQLQEERDDQSWTDEETWGSLAAHMAGHKSYSYIH